MGSETTKLTAADLMQLEEYVARRRDFRAQVLEYKRNRMLALGPYLTLAFENRHTIRYQVQEMLRIENVSDPAGIRGSAAHFLRFELDALQIAVLRNGGAIKFGVDHPEYRYEVVAPAAVRESLLGDLA
jgi:hypothetical protein